MPRRSRRRAYDGRVLKLTIVPASTPPESERLRLKRRADPKPAAMLQCRCGSRDVLSVKIGVLIVAGKPSRGTPQLLCAACFMQGKRVVLA